VAVGEIHHCSFIRSIPTVVYFGVVYCICAHTVAHTWCGIWLLVIACSVINCITPVYVVLAVASVVFLTAQYLLVWIVVW